MKGAILTAVLATTAASVSLFAIQQPERTPEPRFLFIGVVAKPGIYAWRKNLKVGDAIAEAGGRGRGADPTAIFFLVPPDKTRVPARLDDLVKQNDILFIPRPPQ